MPRIHSPPAPITKRNIHLNEKTEPFAVNGSAIPQVPFDLGESYAGSLPVDEGRNLWYWYVPTSNEKASDEIVIWLNGGPGCSSLDGFFHENGPVTWMPGTYAPVRNTYSWSNLTNVVWVEQPIGTGFSTGTVTATSEEDVASQFILWWKNFVDTFDLHDRKVYITGESYAGMYVPYIADAMIRRNDTRYMDVSGIMIYDPSIGDDQILEQVPTLAFTEYHSSLFPFTTSQRAQINEMSATCGYDDYMKVGLQFPPKGPLPPAPGVGAFGGPRLGCDIFDTVIAMVTQLNPCFDIYQVGQLCPLLWDTEGFPYSTMYLPEGYKEPYFNQTSVKQALHAPEDVEWKICADGNVFRGFDQSPPSAINGGPLMRVVEKTNNVIVGHGILDMVLLSNGSLLALQNLTWNGKQGFQAPPNNPFYVPKHEDPSQASWAGDGIYGSWGTERGMTFVTIEMAGHMVPQYQPSAGYRTFELLLGRIANLSEVSPFSTQAGIGQPSVAVAIGGNKGTSYMGVEM
ncbi:alpha/beta-hydrolase [Aulographum hederae CBS 113979]|uniref:Carboxypeptidase n=1 Tax=Aulographum hederae CBS 113979 TaxID=1176131 RepID=A0A6G1GU12_9PEZI|nr:alpha/beta-hydrolase [Aulographum hederae CBS 113979]